MHHGLSLSATRIPIAIARAQPAMAHPAAASLPLRWLQCVRAPRALHSSQPRAPLTRGQRQLSSRAKDLYEVLGIDRRATSDEIKRAYYREAKKNHPDLNKSTAAAERFREVAEAYEVLGDESRRRTYDFSGHTGGHAGASSSHGWGEHPHVDPMHVFRQVWSDLGLEDIEAYFKRVADEAGVAMGSAMRGELEPASRFAREHRGLLISVALPTMLLLRYPGLVVVVTRNVLIFAVAFFRVLPPSIRLQVLSGLWANAVRYLESIARASRGGAATGGGRGGSSGGGSKRP